MDASNETLYRKTLRAVAQDPLLIAKIPPRLWTEDLCITAIRAVNYDDDCSELADLVGHVLTKARGPHWPTPALFCEIARRNPFVLDPTAAGSVLAAVLREIWKRPGIANAVAAKAPEALLDAAPREALLSIDSGAREAVIRTHPRLAARLVHEGIGVSPELLRWAAGKDSYVATVLLCKTNLQHDEQAADAAWIGLNTFGSSDAPEWVQHLEALPPAAATPSADPPNKPVAYLTVHDLADVVHTLIDLPESMGEDMEHHDAFVGAIANVVADYCGGKPELIGRGEELVVEIHATDELPSPEYNVWTQASLKRSAPAARGPQP